MTPPSLEVAREILADAAAKARASGDQFNEIAASAIDVVLAALDLRPPRTVPFVDERGRRIGDAVGDGCQIVARITDEGAAAELRASVGPRGVSVGYRVKVEPEPERARAGDAGRSGDRAGALQRMRGRPAAVTQPAGLRGMLWGWSAVRGSAGRVGDARAARPGAHHPRHGDPARRAGLRDAALPVLREARPARCRDGARARVSCRVVPGVRCLGPTRSRERGGQRRGDRELEPAQVGARGRAPDDSSRPPARSARASSVHRAVVRPRRR